jgi:hypothetical protein
MLRTPIAISLNKGKIVDWVYNYEDIHKLKGQTKFMKGIGSWKEKDLKAVIAKDGLDNMLEPLIFDEEEPILNWYESDKTDKRKEFIMNNEFDIIKI